MANYHVSKRSDGQWQTKQEGVQKSGGLFDTQSEAEKAAKEFSANSGGGEVRIH